MLASLSPAPPIGPHEYQVTVLLTTETATQLAQSGCLLYGLLATETADAAALPLVWYRTAQYGMNTYLRWSTARYQAYTAGSPLAVGTRVQVGFATDMRPGETLAVRAQGLGSVLPAGVGTSIAISNTTSAAFTAGVAVYAEGSSAATPVCGVPLHGHCGHTLVPRPRLFLLFSPVQLPVGCAIRQWPGSASGGLLIDLAGAAQRCVAFDSDAGWAWGDDATWATPVAFGADLQPLLVRPSGTFA